LSFDYTGEDIVKIAQVEHELHPYANLQDYYKLFFQAYFGQGHFISDNILADDFLQEELDTKSEAYLPLIQDIGNSQGLYRLSLELISSGKLSKADFLSLFLKAPELVYNRNTWASNWLLVLEKLHDILPVLLVNKELMVCNEYILLNAQPHHSDCFRLTYHPHYRVMMLTSQDLVLFSTLKELL
jgi:hypothetical protein